MGRCLKKALIPYVLIIIILIPLSAYLSYSQESVIDYSNLTIQDAFKRFLEVDPELNIKKLMLERAHLQIKETKLDVWLPRVGLGASIVKPVDVFTDLHQANGPFAGQQIEVDFTFDSNNLNDINRAKKAHQIAMMEVKETMTARVKELIATFYDLAVAQKGYEFSLQTEEAIRSLAAKVEKDINYSELEKQEIKSYLGVVSEKTIGALNRMQNTNRKLKILLGLDQYNDLKIKVGEIPDNLTKISTLIEEAGLRQPQHTLDLLKLKLEESKITEGIRENPLVKLSWSGGLGIAEGNSLEVQTKATSNTQVSLFITDFGYTKGLDYADRLRSQVLELELRKAEEDLENAELIENTALVELSKKIENYRNYIFRTEDVLKLLKERVAFPIDVVLKISDQLFEARYALKQSMVNYLISQSKISGRKLKPVTKSPEFQNLTLDDLLLRQEKIGKLTEKQILEKKIELQKVLLSVSKAGYFPNLVAAASIENDNIDRLPLITTKAYVAIEGRIFDGKLKHTIKGAQANLRKAEFEERILNNERQDQIIRSYLMMLRISNTIARLTEIKKLKDKIIEDINNNLKSDSPKYTEADVWPLVLQQMELDRGVADLEFSLALAEYTLKKWTNIPIYEKISLKKVDFSDADKWSKNFMELIRKRVIPNYDAQASIKLEQARIDAERQNEEKTIALEGLFWRLKGELRGSDYEGWKKNPNSAITLSITFPWGNREQELKRATSARKRLQAQLSHLKVIKDFHQNKEFVASSFFSSNEKLELQKKKVINAENQFKVTDEFYKIGARTKREDDLAKLESIFSSMLFEEMYFDNLYAYAKHFMYFGDKSPGKKEEKRVILNGLGEAIDLALHNSRQIKVFEDILQFESSRLKYYLKYKIDGSLTGDGARIKIQDPESRQYAKTTVAIATAEVKLINDFLIEQQKKRIRLAEIDLKMEKFKVASEVIQAYIDYLNAMAEYFLVLKQYEKEKAILESLKKLTDTGNIGGADYLKQEEFLQGLLQKRAAINEFCNNFKANLGIVVGGLNPDFSITNLEVYDEKINKRVPIESEGIKERLATEIAEVEKTLAGPSVYAELIERGELVVDKAKLESKIIGQQIKSIAVNVGYAYLTDYLGERTSSETTFSQYGTVGLNLIADKDSKFLSEFIVANSSVNIYEPTTRMNTQISSVDEKIAEIETKQEITSTIQKILQLFDEFKLSVANYENIIENNFATQDAISKELKRAKETGSLTQVREMEIKQFLLNDSIKATEAYSRMMRLRNELNNYLRHYTGKGLDEFVNNAG